MVMCHRCLKEQKLSRGSSRPSSRPTWPTGVSQVVGPDRADRTQTSVVSGLGKKLKVLMDDFQALRARFTVEYREIVERRYFTITGEKVNEDLTENLISSGESESFLQKAIQDQGRGQIMDTISEIQEHHDAVKEIERNLLELHQVFLDMAALVESQGHQRNDIESHAAHASSFVRCGTDQLVEAKEYQKNSRKWTCIAVSLGACVLIVILFPLFSNIMIHLYLREKKRVCKIYKYLYSFLELSLHLRTLILSVCHTLYKH